MQPRVFPIFLMIVNLILTTILWMQYRKTPPAPLEKERIATWGTILLMIPFYLLATYVDLFIAIAITIFAMCLLWGERRWWVALLTALITPAALFLLFDSVLRIRGFDFRAACSPTGGIHEYHLQRKNRLKHKQVELNMTEALQAMGSVVFDPYLVMLIFLTTILGVVIGVLPGLGATTGAALLLPFTLTMEPVHAITVLATIYVSATFAGSITAILINTPGTSAAAATTFDGFPLAQRGEAGRALGVAVVSSTVGGIFSIIVLCIAAPLLARVAYEFRLH